MHRWGEPRATRDVDLTVLALYGDEVPVVEALLDRFTPRRTDAHEFALANRFAHATCPQGAEDFVRTDTGAADKCHVL